MIEKQNGNLDKPQQDLIFTLFIVSGVFRAAAVGLAAMRGVRHVHDMVRGHHHQPGTDVHERRSGRRRRSDPGPAGLSPGARPVPALHTKRPVDHHQLAVRAAHVVPPAQAAPGPDQGQCGGRQGGRPGHDIGKRYRKQLLGPAVRGQGELNNSRVVTATARKTGPLSPGRCIPKLYSISVRTSPIPKYPRLNIP